MSTYPLVLLLVALAMMAGSVRGEEEPHGHGEEGDERTLGLLYKKFKGSKFSLTNGLLGGFYGFRNGLWGGGSPYVGPGLGFRGQGGYGGYGGYGDYDGYGGPGGYVGHGGPGGYYRPGYPGYRGGYEQFPGGYGSEDYDHGYGTKDGAISV